MCLSHPLALDLIQKCRPIISVNPFGCGEPHILSDFPDEARRNIELIDRVLVKLWQQGDRGIVGGSTYDGKIYPHYNDVVYVRWKEQELPDGRCSSLRFKTERGRRGPRPNL